MLKIGIIGYSEFNGHPYSFSSIINGYNKEEYEKTEWLGILNYLEKRDKNEIACLDAKVTHIWSQDIKKSQEIARCSKIENVLDNYLEMIDLVDAVIIARDDYKVHKEIAKPFLEKNIPVLIDKPLTLNFEELEWFKRYYANGLLMSCSGLRFCSELDEVRCNLSNFGKIKLIQASVINGWEKYGIHMLDATLGIFDMEIDSISTEIFNDFDIYTIEFVDGMVLKINTMGSDIFVFDFIIYGTKKIFKTELKDNFTSFKRMLSLFIEQVITKKPSLPFNQLERSIYTLISGRESKRKKEKKYINK